MKPTQCIDCGAELVQVPGQGRPKLRCDLHVKTKRKQRLDVHKEGYKKPEAGE